MAKTKRNEDELQEEIKGIKDEIRDASQSDIEKIEAKASVPDLTEELMNKIRTQLDAEFELKLKQLRAEFESESIGKGAENKDIDYGNARNYTIPDTDKIRDKNGNVVSKTFISPSRGFVFGVYEKEGSYLYSPYKRPIHFRNAVFDKGKSGKAADIVHFSVFSTWSKKESDYIENSPFFGHIIFDSITKARNVVPAILDAIKRSTLYIAGLKEGELLAMAKSYGVQDMSRSEMKDYLGKIKLQEILDSEKSAMNRSLEKFAEAIPTE
jgi:hypothetical protein